MTRRLMTDNATYHEKATRSHRTFVNILYLYCNCRIKVTFRSSSKYLLSKQELFQILSTIDKGYMDDNIYKVVAFLRGKVPAKDQSELQELQYLSSTKIRYLMGKHNVFGL